ncbi:MAG TPA: hypothetical protein VGM63_09390 [Mucilaginibacter sp.]|jgi:hypothetical protein
MEQNNKYKLVERTSLHGGSKYHFIRLLFMLVCPVLSIVGEIIFKRTPIDPILIGKWVTFWAVGIRLFIKGLNQIIIPILSKLKNYSLKNEEKFAIIRELGFAKISLGAMGILSILNTGWHLLAAISGALFYGLAGIRHLFKKPESLNAFIATITDQLVFAMILLYLSFVLFS